MDCFLDLVPLPAEEPAVGVRGLKLEGYLLAGDVIETPCKEGPPVACVDMLVGMLLEST